MAKPDTSAYKTFQQVNDRLDEIVDLVRDKGISLERPRPLRRGRGHRLQGGVGLVDAVDFTPEEEARLEPRVRPQPSPTAPRGEADACAISIHPRRRRSAWCSRHRRTIPSNQGFLALGRRGAPRGHGRRRIHERSSPQVLFDLIASVNFSNTQPTQRT